MEEWKKIPKFRRLEVSDLGRVRTVWEHKVKYLKPMEMKTTVGSYLKVTVTSVETGKQSQIGIHNLVAEAFVPIPENKKDQKIEPNHLDGDKHNNCSRNLEWSTRSENLRHAYATGLKKPQPIGVGVNKSKPAMARNIVTGEIIRATSVKELSGKINIPERTVRYHAFTRSSEKAIRGYMITKDTQTEPPSV